MEVVQSSRRLAALCRGAARELGLVPTMGALHDGHLALVRQARRENATLAVSIFINPSQFGPREDLSQYPRDLERDLELLREEGADMVFTPDAAEMYPPGFDTWVDPGELANRLEGANRPGHFRGVATIVTKLFNLVTPDRAYFGQKDGQQLAVIRRLVRDLGMGLEIVAVPTVREADGLAMSSRNLYLTPDQRQAAPVVYRALASAERLWQQGVTDAQQLRQETRRVLQQEALIERIDYVSVADADSLEELEVVEGRAMVSVAVQLGQPRLIDNIILE
ncbi:MAG: pantoate--beta-alanine ligase [Chloroflexi bacterium]|nr:pantoate--beta-alanine ligase [Chloroflexota bacterium]MCI0895976.1 pantoate--beta-alanine ligase [Chloroflexota bacterium]